MYTIYIESLSGEDKKALKAEIEKLSGGERLLQLPRTRMFVDAMDKTAKDCVVITPTRHSARTIIEQMESRGLKVRAL